MKTNEKHKLTLDRPASYQIIVPGALSESWEDWLGDIVLTVESTGTGEPITILTGLFDQAALQGILRRLYSMGLPLLSVNCIDPPIPPNSP